MSTRKQWSIGAAVVVAAIGVAYYMGQRAGRLDVRRQVTADALQHVTQQLRATEPLLRAQHETTLVEQRKDSAATAKHDAVRQRVRIVSDSQVVVVDTAGVAGPTLVIPPVVVATVRTADSALMQNAVLIHAQAAELATYAHRDSLHIAREHLLEQTIAEASPPRCGRRCGFVLGASAVYAATHPAQVIKAVAWIVRLL